MEASENPTCQKSSDVSTPASASAPRSMSDASNAEYFQMTTSSSRSPDTAIAHGEVVVIIPYYNGSKYIRRSALSVLAQTVPPAEFVVVDDGSTQQEAEKLDQIASEIGFKVLRKKNGGQGSARNFGVAQTTSEFISFLDQDDFYLKNHIEILLAEVRKDDPHFGWVYGDLMEADEFGNVSRTRMVKNYCAHPKQDIIELIRSDMFVLPSASMISREAFESVSGFDEQFMGYEDDDLFLRIFRKGFTNYFVDKPVTVWCINSESTSNSIRMCRSRLKYVEKLCREFPDDKFRARFFIRDLVLPRFLPTFYGETKSAINKRDYILADHRDELIIIFEKFIETIKSSTSLPRNQSGALSEMLKSLRRKRRRREMKNWVLSQLA